MKKIDEILGQWPTEYRCWIYVASRRYKEYLIKMGAAKKGCSE